MRRSHASKKLLLATLAWGGARSGAVYSVVAFRYDEVKPVIEENRRTPGRILALDLGVRRIGVALSDELRITAQGLATLHRTSERQDVARLARLAEEHQVSLILIGNPLRLSGQEGAQSQWARRLAEKVQARANREVVLWDERLTTVAAERVLIESGISRQKRGRAVDRLAAVLLLQSYLDRQAAAQREELPRP